jgi:hypothetical protein
MAFGHSAQTQLGSKHSFGSLKELVTKLLPYAAISAAVGHFIFSPCLPRMSQRCPLA